MAGPSTNPPANDTSQTAPQSSSSPPPKRGFSKAVWVAIAAVVIVVVLIVALLYAGVIPGSKSTSSTATGKVEVNLLNGDSIVASDLTYNGFFNTANTSFPKLLAGSASSSFWGTGQSVLLLAPSLSSGHDTGNLLFRSLAGKDTDVSTVGVFSPSSGDGLDAYLFVNPSTYGNWTGPFFATDPEGQNGTFDNPQGSVMFPYSQTPYIEVQCYPSSGEVAPYHVYMVRPGSGGVVSSHTIQTSNVGATMGAPPTADDYLDFNVSYSTASGTLTGSIYDETAGHAVSEFSDNLTELGFTPSFDLSTPYWFGAGGNGNHPGGWGLLYLGLTIGGTTELTTNWDPAENAYSIGNSGSTWEANDNCRVD